MKFRQFVACLAVFAVLLPVSLAVMAQDEAESTCTEISLFDGWARATVEGAPNGAAFGFLVNLGAQSDTLISATTDAAEAVELHEMTIGEGDVMQMREMEGGFVVPANGYLELAPGGLHIMLINLTQPLAAGEMLDLTLTFEVAGDVEVSLPIREMTVMDGSMMGEATEMSMTEPETASEMSEASTDAMDACHTVYLVDGWVRPAGDGALASAGYGLLLNMTMTDDVLIGVATDAAEVAELHEMTMGENDVMQMRPLEAGIPVAAHGTALLQPGGLHLMLIGLSREMIVGDSVTFTLMFAEAGEIEVTLPVREPMAGGMQMGGMGG
jgi:copper(I)-binding protein